MSGVSNKMRERYSIAAACGPEECLYRGPAGSATSCWGTPRGLRQVGGECEWTKEGGGWSERSMMSPVPVALARLRRA